MDDFQQCVQLVLKPRHFGGGQWYFLCSELKRPALVLWKPPGARFFRCRQYWGSQVAYTSQFGTAMDRAHIGRAKLKAKLCSPNLDDWTIPATPPTCVGPHTTTLSSDTSDMMRCLVVRLFNRFRMTSFRGSYENRVQRLLKINKNKDFRLVCSNLAPRNIVNND
jgi:hypothetical protein